MSNYYEVLGINKNATDDDIKKAFREKAKDFHPDTEPDEAKKKELEEKFKEVNAAYQTLSDPQERAAYDRPPQSQNIPHGFNPFGHGGFNININEMFNRMAGGGGQQFHFSSMNGAGQQFSSIQTFSQEIEISLLDVILENEIEIPLQQIGKTIKFKIPPEFKSGRVLKVRINDEKNPNNVIMVDLKMNVVIPILTEEKKTKLKEILS